MVFGDLDMKTITKIQSFMIDAIDFEEIDSFVFEENQLRSIKFLSF